MNNTVKSAVVKVAGAAGLALAVGTSGLFGGAIASASSSHESTPDLAVGSKSAPAMKVSVSPDEQIRATGIQGTLSNGSQGTLDSADQCTDSSSVKVACVTPSEESVPQLKSK